MTRKTPKRGKSKPRLFDATALADSFRFLERLTPAVLEEAGLHPVGTLQNRAQGVVALGEALLDGRLPEPAAVRWPPGRWLDPLLRGLRDVGVAPFCKGEPELVETLQIDTLRWIEDAHADLLRTRRALRRKKGGKLSVEEKAASEREAQERLYRRIVDAWREQVEAWSAVQEAFGELGELLGVRWDMAKQVLRHVGFDQVQALRALIARLPDIARIAREIGRLRMEDVADAPTVVERIVEPVRRMVEDERLVRTPYAPHEAHGVERGDALARMLPSEAALLTHPVLRLLWHARRADAALLQYELEGLEVERTLREEEILAERERTRPDPQKGPILLCIDTSGSMEGNPETVAKALTFEVVRIAHAEKRRCYLYAFSGPGDVAEHELDLTPDGIGRLLLFLASSFHGGTDVATPMARACAKLGDPGYGKADVLLVSDGDFWVDRGTHEQLAVARATTGVRVHGVLIGYRSVEMERLCDRVHRFSSWDLDVPVESKEGDPNAPPPPMPSWSYPAVPAPPAPPVSSWSSGSSRSWGRDMSTFKTFPLP